MWSARESNASFDFLMRFLICDTGAEIVEKTQWKVVEHLWTIFIQLILTLQIKVETDKPESIE